MRTSSARVLNLYDENLIYPTTGIMQPPFFVPNMPAALSYGSVGAFVGHTLTFGFDDIGAKYDEEGRSKPWYDTETTNAFAPRKQCLVDLFGKQIESHVNKPIDGALTFTKNLADIGGLKAAFLAYKKHLNGKSERPVPGYSKYTNEQTFFIAFGTSTCATMSNELMEHALKEESPPPEFRTNVIVSIYDEFAKAFKCRKGSMMNPIDQCKTW